ncbi:MAG: hypothetical protein KDD04_12450, partial [Sinomicrobium sp.]|nr:hypothetical protein [Sinomicrobium sp.]
EFGESVDKKLLAALPNVQKVAAVGTNRWQISAAGNVDLRPVISAFATKQKLTLLELRKEVFSVEDVFQQLTK